MGMKDSDCRWCGKVFRGLRPGSSAPAHKIPGTATPCPGKGQKTGAHVD